MAVSINKNWLLLAAAIALGGLAFFLSNKAITSRMSQLELEASRGRTMVRVVVASRALQAGELIDSTVVSVREIPAEFVNKTTVLPDNYNAIEGQALQLDVQRGEPLLTSYTASRGGNVFAAVVRPGRRALTIEVDEISSISGLLRPGDRIDLMLTAKSTQGGSAGGAAPDLTFPMLSNVEVLATGRAQKARPAAGEAAAQGFSHITLDVTPDEGTRIIVAKSAGRLTAVLRGPSDKVANSSRAMSINDVVALVSPSGPLAADPAAQRRLVEFIIGGSSGGGSGRVSSSPVLDAALSEPANRALAERVATNIANGNFGAPPAGSVARPADSTKPAAGGPAAPAVPTGAVPVSTLQPAAVNSPAPATGYVRR